MTVSNLTPFGQYARKLRVDHDEMMKEMAVQLNVTPTYLSAVERGKRNAPYEWIPRMEKAYRLTPAEVKALTKAVSESRTYDRIDVSHLPFEDKVLMADLIAVLPTLDVEKRAMIRAWTIR